MKKSLVVFTLIICILVSTPLSASAMTTDNSRTTTSVSANITYKVKTSGAKWTVKQNRYPVAAYVWKYLSKEGFSDAVIAAIIGNMMAEVGGQTMNLRPYTKAGSYYGLCMWSRRYCPKVWGASITKQLNYLVSTMKKEFNNYGRLYKRGFNYTQFKKMTNPSQAARAFARCYERCSSRSYTIRQKNAVKAYNYFRK